MPMASSRLILIHFYFNQYFCKKYIDKQCSTVYKLSGWHRWAVVYYHALVRFLKLRYWIKWQLTWNHCWHQSCRDSARDTTVNMSSLSLLKIHTVHWTMVELQAPFWQIYQKRLTPYLIAYLLQNYKHKAFPPLPASSWLTTFRAACNALNWDRHAVNGFPLLKEHLKDHSLALVHTIYTVMTCWCWCRLCAGYITMLMTTP